MTKSTQLRVMVAFSECTVISKKIATYFLFYKTCFDVTNIIVSYRIVVRKCLDHDGNN